MLKIKPWLILTGFALLSIVITICVIRFALYEPVPSSGISSQQEQEKTANPNDYSNSKTENPKKHSASIKITPSDDTPYEASRRTYEKEYKPSLDRWLTYSTIGLATFTFFLFCGTGILTIYTFRLWDDAKESSIRQDKQMQDTLQLAREEFTATHRPQLAIRSCKLSTINATGDHKYSCKFTCFNTGVSPAYIREIGTRLINRDFCFTAGDREIIFDKNSSDEILVSGAAQIYFTSKSFDWDLKDTNWFFVGYIKYADRQEGGVIREIGFCRRWEPKSMIWNKEDNEEYEYNY